MKLALSVLALLITSFLTAQTANRYYPSLQTVMDAGGDKKMADHFSYFDQWIKELTKAVFVKDLQHSSSPNGDASFNSMGLIFKRTNKFSLGDSDFKLYFNKDKSDFSEPIDILMEQKYPILAYLRSFDANKYNPNDMMQQYDLGIILNGLSQEQIIADYINRFVQSNSKRKRTSVQQLLKDIKKKIKIKIEINEAKDREILKSIATQIYKKANKYSSTVLYDVYIKDSNAEKEKKNVENFFKDKKFQILKDIDQAVGYQTTITIPKKELTLQIPVAALQSVDSINASPIEVKVHKIELKVKQLGGNRYIEIITTFKDNNSSGKFIAPQEIELNKSTYQLTSPRKLSLLETKNINQLHFRLYEEAIEVDLVTEEEQHLPLKIFQSKIKWK